LNKLIILFNWIRFILDFYGNKYCKDIAIRVYKKTIKYYPNESYLCITTLLIPSNAIIHLPIILHKNLIAKQDKINAIYNKVLNNKFRLFYLKIFLFNITLSVYFFDK